MASLMGWLAGLDWVSVVLLGFSVLCVVMGIRDYWKKRKDDRKEETDTSLAPSIDEIILSLLMVMEEQETPEINNKDVYCHPDLGRVSVSHVHDRLRTMKESSEISATIETEVPFFMVIHGVTDKGRKRVDDRDSEP